jgi:polysaccharide deacetylase family protein (PEP-CTERM system associated)
MDKSAHQRQVLAVVVEDYCHVAPASHVISADTWYRFESRAYANTCRTLDLLDAVGARATFFVLGWVAEHQPRVVDEIVDRGHEIASKGYLHESIRHMPPAAFREDVVRSRRVLEDAAGVAVRGYRTPRGGFGQKDLWALDILADEDFAYDASLRPTGLAFAGEPVRRFIHKHGGRTGRSIWEVPISSARIGPFSVPVGGGNYVRQLPQAFVRQAIADWVATAPTPLVFYFHVWELDPDQPRISGMPMLERMRQYRNLSVMPERISAYLQQYTFGSIAEYLKLGPAPAVDRRPAESSDVPTATEPDEAAADAAATVPASVVRPPQTPVSIVVPCFNEEPVLGYLANTLDSFARTVCDRYDVSYIFVDDGSTDRTWQRLHQLFGQRPDSTLLRHARNRGIAAAVLTGIRHSRTEIVCCIDADGTFDPHQLPEMIPLLKPGVDVVTSTCFGQSGRVQNVPAWRLALSRGATVLYRLVLRNKLSHYTSCFRVYRRQSVIDITLADQRYVGITEILARMDLRGSKIVEFPATLEVRVLGRSKMKILRTIGGHLQLLARLALRRLAPRRLKPATRDPATRDKDAIGEG